MDHGILSIAPAVLAIVLAVLSRNVILSLFSAVAVAGIIHVGGDPIDGVIHGVSTNIVGAIADKGHAKTMLFTLLIGATVAIIGKSGGTTAVVEALAKRAKSPRAVQVLSWLSGMIVFFDDYANCMIVGSAMSPLYDKYNLSRAKLAYIVDSTAAPVASLALVSTWVGFEVSQIEKGFIAAKKIGVMPAGDIQPYGFFVEGWPYRFYPILAILFVGMIAISGRDFGPMLTVDAARSTKRDENLEETGNAPWWVAALPVVTLVAVTLLVLYTSGRAKVPGADARLFEILAQADGYGAILQGSLAAVILAVFLTLVTGSLSLEKTTDAAVDGMKLMFEALIILVLAWSLSSAMGELDSAKYMAALVEGRIPIWLLPTVVFLVCSGIAFAVGSSYTTMGVVMPLALPIAFQMSGGDMMIPLAVSGSVLAGACFGDHCSPISDTTVLSSVGSGADHLAHVRTQIPYALAIAGVSVVFGTLPAGFGVNPWILLLIGTAVSYALLRYFGKINISADAVVEELAEDPG